MDMDGYFDYENKNYGYIIVDDDNPIRNVNGIEKMSRGVNIYLNGEHVCYFQIYGKVDELTNITHFMILDEYKNRDLRLKE